MRLFSKTRCRRDDNIKTDLKEAEYEDVILINLAQDREQWRDLVNTTMNITRAV
jgi:hypothetical protein